MNQRYHSRNPRVALALTALLTAGSLARLAAEPIEGGAEYTFTPVPKLAGYNRAVAVDLNNAGVSLLRAENGPAEPTHGYTWNGTKTVDLGTLGGASTVPLGIADDGRVVGRSQDAASRWLPFLGSAGQMQPLPLPPGYDGGEAKAIAPDGAIGGTLFRGGRQRAVMWTAEGIRFLPLVPPYGSSRLEDLASGGRAVGTVFHETSRLNRGRPILWNSSAAPVDLGVLPGYTFGQARAINEAGQVVGISSEPPYDRWHRAFLWQDGTLKGLSGWSHAGDANSINSSGEIVGMDEVYLPRTYFPLATLWEAVPNHWRRYLGQVTQYSAPTERTNAVAINDTGQILVDARPDRGTPLLATPDDTASPTVTAPPPVDSGEGLEDQATRPVVRPLRCEFTREIRAHYLNDPSPLPHAWNVSHGEIPARERAHFHVYGFGRTGEWWNVTQEGSPYQRRVAPLRVQLTMARGSAVTTSRVYYAEMSGTPRIIFDPAPAREDRKAVLTFRYHCTAPYVVYQTTYTLLVKGTGSAR